MGENSLISPFRLPIGNFYIGRKRNPEWNFLSLPSIYASQDHCKIECLENGQIFLSDTSRSGKFVNGRHYLSTTVELGNNDRIGMFSLLLNFWVKINLKLLTGIGFNVNRNNAINTDSRFGFVLERTVKDEPESNTDEAEQSRNVQSRNRVVVSWYVQV